MPSTTVGLKKLQSANFAVESVKGTLLASVVTWLGKVSYAPVLDIQNPGYPQGIPGAVVVEDTFAAEAGMLVNLEDFPLSVEQMAYIQNLGIKKALTSAGTTPFLLDNFAFPTSATVNDIATWTGQFDDGIQKFECGYLFCEKFSEHGERGQNGGVLMANAQLRGRKRATGWTGSPTPAPLAVQPLNIDNLAVKVDALGTAAGSGAAVSNWVIGYNLDVETGWQASPAAAGRSSLDFGIALYNGEHKVTGSLICLMDANSITQIANARSATGIVLQLVVTGGGVRKLTRNLPIYWTKDPDWGKADRNGFHEVTLEFEAGYSRTSTAQGISMPINMAASTTLS